MGDDRRSAVSPRSTFAASVIGLACFAIPADVRGDSDRTGESTTALPGVARVAVAGHVPPGVSISTYVAYGFSGAILADGDSHHRAATGLATSLRPVPWLAFSLRLDGRYDRHLNVPNGTDDGWVGDPRVFARTGTALSGGWKVGAQLGLWLPGDAPPSITPRAMTPELLLLATYEPRALPMTFSINGGARLDRSAASVENADVLSQADRLALGVSDFDALLVGIGATYRMSRIELLGEWTGDLLVGDGAPPALSSPMRATAGIRYTISHRWQGQLLIEMSPSRRPAVGSSSPLVPIEPRVSVLLGLAYVLPFDREEDRVAPAPAPPVSEETPAESAEPDAPAILLGRVTTKGGAAIRGARVRVASGEDTIETVTTANGTFELSIVARGEIAVSVRAEGYKGTSRSLTARSWQILELDIVLEPTIAPGQLRGVVRSFRGKPLRASIQIGPAEIELTADEHGSFQVDLPPGDYEIRVHVPGYSAQRRTVTIEQDGVTILNVDLRRKR